jgi:hypothetical protein
MVAMSSILAQEYAENGFALARGLFSPAECESFLAHYMAMVERGGDGWAEGGVDANHPDPLVRYPRLLQPHRGDRVSFEFMLDPRLKAALTAIAGEEPLAVQTMVYFKPPGARGQALHQDNRYLCVEPGTCLAAWLALEDIDEETGCLEVVPGSHRYPMLCPGSADMERSFTGDQVPLPPGLRSILTPMRQGDTLFFHGALIHGSAPNQSTTRFRRILVGHYIAGDAQSVARYYFPCYRFDGSVVDNLKVSSYGGPCGTFDTDGNLITEGHTAQPAGIH